LTSFWHYHLKPSPRCSLDIVNKGVLRIRDCLGEIVVGFSAINIRQLAHRRAVGINDEQTILSASKNPIDEHLAPLDANDGAGTGIYGFVLASSPVAEHDNDLVLTLLADQGLESLDPVDERLQVGLFGAAAKQTGVLMGLPGHG
jgi:hypothetical protein